MNRESPDPYSSSKPVFPNDDSLKATRTAFIFIGASLKLSESELDGMLNMVYAGRHVFLSAYDIGENLLDSLGLKVARAGYFYGNTDSLRVQVVDPVSEESGSYTYPGRALDNYFTSMDSTITYIMGYNNKEQANYIRIDYKSGGSIYLHLAPMALTNFFLLHKQNKSYYDQVFSYLPANIELIRWDEYFRYNDGKDNKKKSNFSALQWIAKQPGLNAAWWLVLLLLLVLFLVESKRRQRILPRLAAPRNSSLDFVKTIGRLYYQRKDNQNLAQKMAVHFQDHVRHAYHLRTAVMDEAFEKKLADKSGCDLEALRSMLYDLRLAQHDPFVSDESLLALDRQLKAFYNYAKTI